MTLCRSASLIHLARLRERSEFASEFRVKGLSGVICHAFAGLPLTIAMLASASRKATDGRCAFPASGARRSARVERRS